MSFYTPRGLKLRFDPEALEPVVRPLKKAGVFEDILMDLELWVKLPNTMSNVAAILAAFCTNSWSATLAAGIGGYLLGRVIYTLIYSNLLKALFPMFLGSWVIAIPAAIACGIPLVTHGHAVTAVVLASLVLGNWLGITDILQLLMLPLHIWLTNRCEQLSGIRVAMAHVDCLFMFLCERRASGLGIQLEWEAYDRMMEEKQSRPIVDTVAYAWGYGKPRSLYILVSSETEAAHTVAVSQGWDPKHPGAWAREIIRHMSESEGRAQLAGGIPMEPTLSGWCFQGETSG